MKKLILLLLLVGFSGCGASDTSREPSTPTPAAQPANDPDRAIGIVRNSFEAMGGLERLRLIGGKAVIQSTVKAAGETFSVSSSIGGPDKWHLNYMESDATYTYVDGTCRKTIWGAAASCTPAEKIWMTPVRILSGLIFPASDAANLRASFQMDPPPQGLEDESDAVEIRPQNSNLKIQALYDKETGLLSQMSFPLKNEETGKKTIWTIQIGDWREVAKALVPFQRTVLKDNDVVWEETAEFIDFDSFDNWIFKPPVPPTMDHVVTSKLPRRNIVPIRIDAQQLEIPAPPAAPGGGPPLSEPFLTMPEAESMHIIFRGTTDAIGEMKKKLLAEVESAKRKAASEPSTVLLEAPQVLNDPYLLMVYVPLIP